MPVQGTRLVVNNIKRFGGGFLGTVNGTMTVIEKMLRNQVDENISLSDHGPRDLSALDNPYAARHGSQGLRIHNPYWQVHEQSGELRISIESGTVKASLVGGKLKASAFAGLNEGQAEHALYVVFGTSRMIPRPVLEGSRDQVKGQALALLNKTLKGAVGSFR